MTQVGETRLPVTPGTMYSLQEVYEIRSSAFGGNANLTIDLRVAPVPEPGTLALLGAGVVGLAGLLRHKLNL